MARAEMRECCGKLTRITDTTNISSFFCCCYCSCSCIKKRIENDGVSAADFIIGGRRFKAENVFIIILSLASR